MRRITLLAGLLVIVPWVAHAEPNRPLLSKENAFPGLYRFEVGTSVISKEITDETFPLDKQTDELFVVPLIRFGLTENLTAFTTIPYRKISRDIGKDDSGLGDITVGLELLAFEGVFDYPYIIPHIEIGLGTGDERERPGEGETSTTIGISIGSVSLDVYHVIFDIKYKVSSGDENILTGAVSAIWDISDKLAFLVEASLSDHDETMEDDSERPALFQGGLVYEPNKWATLGIYGGATKNTDEDNIITVKGTLDL